MVTLTSRHVTHCYDVTDRVWRTLTCTLTIQLQTKLYYTRLHVFFDILKTSTMHICEECLHDKMEVIRSVFGCTLILFCFELECCKCEGWCLLLSEPNNNVPFYLSCSVNWEYLSGGLLQASGKCVCGSEISYFLRIAIWNDMLRNDWNHLTSTVVWGVKIGYC